MCSPWYSGLRPWAMALALDRRVPDRALPGVRRSQTTATQVVLFATFSLVVKMARASSLVLGSWTTSFFGRFATTQPTFWPGRWPTGSIILTLYGLRVVGQLIHDVDVA